MKKCLIPLIAGSLVGICAAREFKSADGAKTIEAEFIRYDPRTSKVTLLMPNGRNMVSDATLFSEADQAFFKEEYRKGESEGAISVRGHDKLDRGSFRKDKLLITFTDADYVFTIKNDSDIDFENLEVKFWVVTERYNEGRELNETSSGSANVPKLKRHSEEKVDGPSIRLITGAVPAYNTDNETEARRIANEAAKYGRDRDLGWRVEVYGADGKKLHADSSSIRVDRILGADEKKD